MVWVSVPHIATLGMPVLGHRGQGLWPLGMFLAAEFIGLGFRGLVYTFSSRGG